MSTQPPAGEGMALPFSVLPPLEGWWVGVLLVALNLLALAAYQVPVTRTEALSQWQTPLAAARLEVMLHEAEHGRRADAELLAQIRQVATPPVRRPEPELRLDDRGFAIALTDLQGHRRWMHWTYVGDLDSPVSTWRCNPVPGQTPEADAAPREWLPPICRSIP